MIRPAEYLPNLPFYNYLNEGEKALILENWTSRSYPKGQIIYAASDTCLGFILICKGELRAYVNSAAGREITLFRLSPNDTCALSDACVLSQISFDTQMIATKDTTILALNSGVFKKLIEQNIHVRCYIYELLATRFSRIIQTMQRIIFMGYDRRLAIFLLDEYTQTGKRTIKMTHEQIAEHTNSAREVVARMLKKFANEGIVEYKRGAITITDLILLRSLAES